MHTTYTLLYMYVAEVNEQIDDFSIKVHSGFWHMGGYKFNNDHMVEEGRWVAWWVPARSITP